MCWEAMAAVLDAGHDAAGQVLADDDAFELVDSALDRVGLFQDVDAIRALIHHPANPPHLALDSGKTAIDAFTILCSHRTNIPHRVSDCQGALQKVLQT